MRSDVRRQLAGAGARHSRAGRNSRRKATRCRGAGAGKLQNVRLQEPRRARFRMALCVSFNPRRRRNYPPSRWLKSRHSMKRCVTPLPYWPHAATAKQKLVPNSMRSQGRHVTGSIARPTGCSFLTFGPGSRRRTRIIRMRSRNRRTNFAEPFSMPRASSLPRRCREFHALKSTAREPWHGHGGRSAVRVRKLDSSLFSPVRQQENVDVRA